jgi:hypothetical protein
METYNATSSTQSTKVILLHSWDVAFFLFHIDSDNAQTKIGLDVQAVPNRMNLS